MSFKGGVAMVLKSPATAFAAAVALVGYESYKAAQNPSNKPQVTYGKFGGAYNLTYAERLAQSNAKQSSAIPSGISGGELTGAGMAAIGKGRTPVNLQADAAAAKAAADRQSKIKTQMDALVKLSQSSAKQLATIQRDNAQQIATIERDNAQRVAQINRDHNQQMQKLDRDYKQQQNAILDTYNTNKLNAETSAAAKLVTLQKDTAQKIADAQKSAADQQLAIVQQSIDLMRTSFSNVTGYDIGSHFADGIKYGFTVGANDLVKQMQDHLKSIQQLQDDAGKLAGLGYTQTFIDQVIAQGPKIGDQLAQALMKADPTTTGSIQDLYANIQNTSTHGLDALAASMNQGGQLATEQLTASYDKVGKDLEATLNKITADSKDAEAQIQSDLNTTLVQLAKDRDKSMADALQSYQDQMADMNTAYQNQLADAAQSLSNSLQDAAQALNNKLADMLASMLESLTAINDALAGITGKGGGGGNGGGGGGNKGIGTIVPSNVLQDWSLFNAARRADDAAAIASGSTYNIAVTANTNATPAEIANSVVSAAKYGQVVVGTQM
jgi:hypothetical protein